MASPVVRGLNPTLVGAGCHVTVSGAGFLPSTKVFVGTLEMKAEENDDFSLVFSAPNAVGEYEVTLANGDSRSGKMRLVVVELKDVPARSLPRRTGDDFRGALLGLLPRGFAWYKGKDGNWWKLFSAFGATFSAAYETFRLLVSESSPVKTTSFDEWERELGLPKKGLQFSDDAGRLSEIFRISRRSGGCTVPYFEGIVSLFGTNCRIYEYWKNPEEFSGVDFGTGDPNFYWKVVLERKTSETAEIFDCQSECDDFLRKWWMDNIEELLELMKPAHTELVFTYVDADGNPVSVGSEEGE